jgi:hypothetical protein
LRILGILPQTVSVSALIPAMSESVTISATSVTLTVLVPEIFSGSTGVVVALPVIVFIRKITTPSIGRPVGCVITNAVVVGIHKLPYRNKGGVFG